jgi:hypothetical protein
MTAKKVPFKHPQRSQPASADEWVTAPRATEAPETSAQSAPPSPADGGAPGRRSGTYPRRQTPRERLPPSANPSERDRDHRALPESSVEEALIDTLIAGTWLKTLRLSTRAIVCRAARRYRELAPWLFFGAIITRKANIAATLAKA